METNRTMQFYEWLDDVTEELEMLALVTRSDAQGIIEAQDFKVSQCWGRGLSPTEAATEIDRASFANGSRS